MPPGCATKTKWSNKASQGHLPASWHHLEVQLVLDTGVGGALIEEKNVNLRLAVRLLLKIRKNTTWRVEGENYQAKNLSQ